MGWVIDEKRGKHAPLSRNLNSIVPCKGLGEPSRAMLGLKGAHAWKATARFSSVTYGGRLDMYKRGSCT